MMSAAMKCCWLVAACACAVIFAAATLDEAVTIDSRQECQDKVSANMGNMLLQVNRATAVMNGSHAKSKAWDDLLHGHGKKKATACSGMNLSVPASPKERQLKNLRWLHFPKAGTSFIATIWNYACGQDKLLDLDVDPASSSGCMQCYDFALMDRYPLSSYCQKGVLEETSSATFLTQHQPLVLANVEAKGEDYVGFFRQPSQRLISGYYNALHASGFDSVTNSMLHEKCGSQGAGCYASFPGIAGCTARMLTGLDCADGNADPDSFDGGASHLEDALKNIDRMAFVGLTERWDDSICLFHRMFGGRMSTAQMVDFHQGSSNGNAYDESELDGFIDSVDEKIYATAKTRFEALLSEHVPDGEEPCGNALKTTSVLEDDSEQCSCQLAAAECGTMEQSTVDCGQCPTKRLAIVAKETSKVTCDLSSQKCMVDGESDDLVYNGRALFAWDISA